MDTTIGRAAIIVLASLLVGVSAVHQPLGALVIPTVVLGALLLVLARVITRNPEGTHSRPLRLALFSFGLHVAIGAMIISSQKLTILLGSDALVYDESATRLADFWAGRIDTMPPLAAGKSGFVYMIAAAYWLLGPFAIAGVIINGALSAVMLLLTWDTTRRLFGVRAADAAAVMLLVFPAFLVWPSQLLREAPILLLLALAANAGVRLSERFTPAGILTVCLALALLFTVRANISLLAAAGLLAGISVGRRQVLAGMATGGVSALTIAAIVLAGGVGYTGYRYVADADLARVSEVRQNLASNAATGIAPTEDISTGSSALRYLPVAVVNFTFGPFPWQARTGFQFSGVLDGVTIWFLVPSFVRGWRSGEGPLGRQRLVLLLPAVSIALGSALLLGNLGLIVRQRPQMMIFLLPFIAHGWVLRRQPAEAQHLLADASTEAPGLSAV